MTEASDFAGDYGGFGLDRMPVQAPTSAMPFDIVGKG